MRQIRRQVGPAALCHGLHLRVNLVDDALRQRWVVRQLSRRSQAYALGLRPGRQRSLNV